MQKTSRFALLLAGALTLGACGQPATPSVETTQPAQPQTAQTQKSLGLYALNINGIGENQVQASVSRVEGLKAQAAEIEGLKFDILSNATVADNVARVLHITTSFTVTNTTTQTINVPTYIPVDTDGAYATDGTTPFRNVVTRKGAPISGSNIRVERSYRLSGGIVAEDPNATPLVGNLDTGALQLNLPAGTTAPGISHQGWQTATLAPGQSQVVNFAMRVPLQLADVSDNDPFRFTLVFAVADNLGTANLTNIASVQGATPAGNVASPLSGQSVTVEGVVTSVLPGLSGFFVQEEGLDADEDGATSDGVFVYCAASCPTLSAGTRVKVTGTVAEFGGGTQLTAPSVTVMSTSIPAPAAVSLTLPFDKAQQERLEGMRVTFPETLTVTNNYTYGRYGQLDLSNNGRVFNPTNGNAKTGQSTVTLDDGQSVQNPLNLPYLSAENTRRTGDTVTGLSGIWHSVANLPMIEPEGAVNFVSTNSRAENAQPKPVNGTLRVGGANVLNYFTTYGSTTDRGATNAAELQRQRIKMTQNLVTLNADVLTLMEVQNNGDTALNDLVAALNEKAGAGTYAAVQTGTVGTDAIKVAVIYQPAKVTPVGQPMIDTNSVFSRPPVAQTFRENATGAVFSVVANHFKSKGSCSTSDPDTGQGCWNNLRVQQSQALLSFVSRIQQTSGDSDVMVMGDLNAYGAEDPIKTLQNGGFESLNLRIPAEDRYSYQFSGQFGYLDHALASSSLSAQVTGITEWHVNSDEPVIADYNTEFKKIAECTPGVGGSANTCQGTDLFDPTNPFRASDHDPVLVGLSLTGSSAPVTPTPTASLSANPTALSVTAGGTASSTLTLTAQNYAGGDFTVTTSNSAGLSVSAPATAAAGSTFTVSVSAPAGLAAGTYPVTVTATGANGLSTATTLTVSVAADGTVTPPASNASGLIFSEYVEGSSSNKALEIYNPTAAAVDLSTYSVELYSNGATTATNTQRLSGTLAPGATLVLVNGSAVATLKAMGTVSSVTNFNGDDALLLKNGGTVVDSFGQVGAAVKWGENVTLRRKVGIVAGDTDPSNTFSAANEWDSLPLDTFDGLGQR